jgi:hypothetical protein
MDLNPELVWGVFVRCLGLVYAVAFGAMIPQILPLVGSRGVTPLTPLLRAYRRDCGPAWRFWWLPSVLHFSHSDTVLVALPVAGTAFGLLTTVGGSLSPLWLGLAWATLLSLDPAMGLAYPWDSFLLEMGFLAAWLPPLRFALDGVGISALPTPLLAFSFHWLLFRLMLGFGKIKFIGTTWSDRLYIRNFLLAQPIPSKGAWLAFNTLPDAVWVGSLFVMAMVEMVLPFGAFFPGWPRQVFALGTIALMVRDAAGCNEGCRRGVRRGEGGTGIFCARVLPPPAPCRPAS